MKILSIYLLIKFNGVFIRIVLTQIIFMVLIFGFGVSYLFTQQIKSAHRPTKSCYKILTRNLNKQQFGFYFKWKVK